MDTRTVRANKEICKECRGNGYVTFYLEEGREECVADCNTCDSQGEIITIIEESIQ
jgi:DnaJ-class molecular chaperone